MFLFSATSWYFLKSFYEHEALSDARIHLVSIQVAYQKQIDLFKKVLITEADKPLIVGALTNSKLRTRASSELSNAKQQYPAKSVSVISLQGRYKVLIGDENVQLSSYVSLINQARHGKIVSALQTAKLGIAVPIPATSKNSPGVFIGALLAVQDINDDFAFELSKITSVRPSDNSLNIVLCELKRIVGTTIRNIAKQDLRVSEGDICTQGALNIIGGTEHYLTVSTLVQTQDQPVNSPSLVIVDVEPLYNITAHTERAVQIMVGLAVFIITLGVTAYALVAKTFFIHPIRRLQARVAALVAENSDAELTASTLDELSMLTRSFSLLSESLDTREYESNVITRQMGDLLAMSDVLISTLNLEDLLGEIVSRLGHIMHAQSVSLLLFGREMQSPWAVARWSNQQQSNGSIPVASLSSQNGAVTVHTDPEGDITKTATFKMAAIVAPATRSVPSSSGKRSAIHALKLTSQREQVAMHLPRIPRPALSEIDMTLGRMAMQKQKIIYGEDIQMIFQDRGEAWAQMALEAGHRSVISVSLLLQEQTIGAIVLYGDRPYQMSRRDTFLLSTAAIQAAMAIQNALLFAEVKDKNAALERVNHLKSQFLATVTHELRTPLHSIISYGALILEGFVEGELTAEQEEHIQFIVRRAEDLSRLVDDMLDLSKIEADRLEVKVEPLELESSLTEVVNQLKPMANTKGLQLALEVEDSLPKVLADSQRIRQVVINMVSNALKFTEKGGVTIRCTQLERYDMLRISVCDTGIGISPAALDYIFEAFRQADGSTTRRFGGTGLGLTIARKLIELQGGEVSVESIVGQGSTFSFTLPIASPTRVHT
jgi:signal transduction histidine kinase